MEAIEHLPQFRDLRTSAHNAGPFVHAVPALMKIPTGLQPLIDDGIIDEVLRPLKSGKEASV